MDANFAEGRNMMDEEANRTRSGFQAGGLGWPDPPPREEPQQPSGTMGGALQPQQWGHQSGAPASHTGHIGQQRHPPQQTTGQGGGLTTRQMQFGVDPAYFQQQPLSQ